MAKLPLYNQQLNINQQPNINNNGNDSDNVPQAAASSPGAVRRSARLRERQ